MTAWEKLKAVAERAEQAVIWGQRIVIRIDSFGVSIIAAIDSPCGDPRFARIVTFPVSWETVMTGPEDVFEITLSRALDRLAGDHAHEEA